MRPTAFFDPVQKCIHKDGFNTILDICRKAAAGIVAIKKKAGTRSSVSGAHPEMANLRTDTK
jgi:hypothetical protein